MFPLRDDNPTVRLSIITIIIIVLNGFVWVFVQGLGTNPALVRSICTAGLIPAQLFGRLPEGMRLPMGQDFSYLIPNLPNWSSLVTHMFLHGGWFHIIGNLWFLWVFGDNVEDAMGRIRFVFFYLLCGLGAAAAQMLSDPSSTVPMVGASGAISGVMGAYAVLYPRANVQTLVFLGFFIRTFNVPAFFMLGYWFVLQFLGAVPSIGGHGGGVAFWAHIGGFLTGVLLIFPFRNPERLREHRRLAGF
jgi:membrane associated rhomboid family serine protease